MRIGLLTLELLCKSCIFLLLFLSKPSAVLALLHLPDMARVRVREPDTTRTSWVKLMRGLTRTIGEAVNKFGPNKHGELHCSRGPRR